MAPVNSDLQTVQGALSLLPFQGKDQTIKLTRHQTENVKNVIQDLFQILAQISNYDSAGRPSRDALAQDLSVFPFPPPPPT